MTVKGFKGFDKNLVCRDKQYEIGKTFEEDVAELCTKGMHFCTNPHDIFAHYGAGAGNRFCKVEAEDATDPEKAGDSKRAAKKLTIKAEISVFQICKIAVSSFFLNFNFSEKLKSADSNQAGDYGAANAGDYGAANAGYCGAANAGDYGAANAGNRGAANAGDYGAANAGDYGAASVKSNGVAIASTDGRVRGGLGSILVLINRDYEGNILGHAVRQVDGDKIKADTWYRLVNGEFVEIKE